MEKIKIIIAEDSDFVRDGMRIILDVDEENMSNICNGVADFMEYFVS